ncbi:putative holin-like toxin [Peribacillus frigoritolerans]|uniref:putative holin-like toxin n=1 Tax=Peribacillus frigoritolerans TaxID=450367 RepID=UPI0039C18D59
MREQYVLRYNNSINVIVCFMGGSFLYYPLEKGADYMSVYEALSLCIAFSMLILAITDKSDKK